MRSSGADEPSASPVPATKTGSSSSTFGTMGAADTPYLGREGGLYPSLSERSAPYLAEFVGGFVLTCCYLCNLSNLNLAGGASDWVISSNALMVVALVSALGHISGANLNPSVSIALYLSGRQALSVTGAFCAVQIMGAVAAAGVVHLFLGDTVVVELGPKPGFGAFEVMLVEVLYTGMICFVFLNCAGSPQNNPTRDQNGFVGLATGLCFIAGGYASKDISGSVMNPSISFGLQLADLRGPDPSGWAMFYFLAEVAGAFLAAGAFRVVRPGEVQRVVGSGALVEVAREVPVSASIMAEFIGTFYVIFTKAMVHGSLSATEPWAVSCALTSMIYSLRGVSGAHFNPAVTLAVVSSGREHAERPWAMFVGAQVFAGISATAVYAIVHHGFHLPIVPPQMEIRPSSVVTAEMLFTCFLCYVVLATSVVPNPVPRSESQQNNIAGLAVGSCQMIAGVSVGKVSGSILNPATALGYSGLAGLRGDVSSVCLTYIAYEAFGALLASAIFRTTHASLYSSKKEPMMASTSGGEAYP